MSFCPSCSAELAPDAEQCANCGALFGDGSTWKPLGELSAPQPPSLAARIFFGIAKVVTVGVSLAALSLGGLVAAAENNQSGALLMAVVGVAVVTVALVGRLRWVLLALFIAVPVGLTTCVANFKWHGG